MMGVTTVSTEVLFNVEEADEGGFVATAPAHGIVTQAETVAELHVAVRDAVSCHFEPADKPGLIRLHFVRDEILAA